MVTQSQVRDTTKVTWQIDPSSTYVQFGVRHMGVSTVRGRFPDVKGTIVVDHDDPTTSTAELTIGTASLDTGNAMRDEYVRTEAFLDVERFPTMTFRSTRVELLAGGPQALVTGEL